MIAIELDPELELMLSKLAEETGRSESSFVAQAVRQFLEDAEDYRAGIEALERSESSISLEELEHKLGFEPPAK